jgi:hypothetical protein
VYKPEVSCPLSILPQREDLQNEVTKALEKTQDDAELALRQVEATIVSFINKSCVHITGLDSRVIFALTDVVQLSQGKSKSCFKYCDYPVNATGMFQMRAHWGTMNLGSLQQRLADAYAAKGGARRDAERRAGADVKRVSRAGELWFDHPQHRVATQGEFAPPCDYRRPAELDKSVFNLYSGPGITYEEAKTGGGKADGPGAVGFLQYLKDMFPPASKGGDKTLDAFLYWAAQLVQCPGIKPPLAPVFRGNKGCGKTACVTLLQFVVGIKYCTTPLHEKGVSGEFATTKGKLLVFSDETGFAGDHQGQKTMKKMVSSTVSSGRNLYERESTYMNFARLACATNERQAVQLDDDSGAERRWILIQCRGAKRDLSHLFTEEAVRDIAAFLYEYELKPAHGDPDRFMGTDASAHQLIESKFGSKDLIGFILSMLTHPIRMFPSEMTSEGLYTLYTTWADHVRVHANQRLAKGVLCRELKSVFEYQTVGKDRRKKLPERDCAIAAIAARMGLPAAALSSYMEDQDQDQDDDARVKTDAEVLADSLESLGLAPAPAPAPAPVSALEPEPAEEDDTLLDQLIDEEPETKVSCVQAEAKPIPPRPTPRPRKQVARVPNEIDLELGELYTDMILEGHEPPQSLLAAVNRDSGAPPLTPEEADQARADARSIMA